MTWNDFFVEADEIGVLPNSIFIFTILFCAKKHYLVIEPNSRGPRIKTSKCWSQNVALRNRRDCAPKNMAWLYILTRAVAQKSWSQNVASRIRPE